MSDNHQDNQPIDPVIRAALRARQVPASDECLDPETMAAWCEGGLDAARVAVVDAHLADCARCQAMLASLTESSEAAASTTTASAVVVPFAKPSRMRWIAPIAAGLAAAGLIFWMVLPSSESPSAPESTLAQRAETPAPLPTPPAPVAPLTAPEQQAAAATKFGQSVQSAGPAAKPSQPAPTPLPLRGSAGVVAPAAAQPDPKVTLNAPPPPPPPPLPSAVTTPAPAQARATPTPTPAAPPAAASAVAVDQALARADRNALKFETGRKYPIEFGPPVAQSAGRGGAGGSGAGGRAAGSVSSLRTTSAPAPAIRWRILETGRVERTVNAGATWTPVPLEGPVFITAGAAASPTVVWLVGREGVVFRSIDGATFARVVFPHPFDLEAVTTDGVDRATVSTRDGRVFVTTDGGHTWRSN